MISKKTILMFLVFTFLILSSWYVYINNVIDDKKNSSSTNSINKGTENTHKNFSYSDIINSIHKSSNKFALVKIEKNSVNKSFVNTEVKYKGEIEELIQGLKIMKMQETMKGVNEVNIEKSENNQYIAEINVDFLKFK